MVRSTLNGRAVARAIPAIQHGRPVTAVIFTDGGQTVVTGGTMPTPDYREPFPAGPVMVSGHAAAPHKPRVSARNWRGEGGRRSDDLIANMAAYDK